MLSLFAVVADQPRGEVGLVSELAAGTLASLLNDDPVQLTWANGLLALTTDMAAGLAHLHGLQLYHGRLFPVNVMITSAWRAKLCEYHLDNYLAATRSRGLLEGGGIIVPSSSRGANGATRLGDLHLAREVDRQDGAAGRRRPEP